MHTVYSVYIYCIIALVMIAVAQSGAKVRHVVFKSESSQSVRPVRVPGRNARLIRSRRYVNCLLVYIPIKDDTVAEN